MITYYSTKPEPARAPRPAPARASRAQPCAPEALKNLDCSALVNRASGLVPANRELPVLAQPLRTSVVDTRRQAALRLIIFICVSSLNNQIEQAKKGAYRHKFHLREDLSNEERLYLDAFIKANFSSSQNKSLQIEIF
ncbi:hypothetical protein [Symbiopectobacterium sp. RP]|uniref:hypothetical protein n=1 Tax=Symbiopectobacterium sp. RP TaxID=3248553 RepID=UPI003D28DE8D